MALKATIKSLGEVTVLAEKRAIESKIDRVVVNVSKDLNSAGGSAIDVLRNVPSLNVNADGVVSLRGSSDISILVDGRPTSIDASRLDQIASADIESIEVLTNASAKYSPEGKSGIINIKLKPKSHEGINGNGLLTIGTGHKYNAGFNLNYNLGKVGLSAAYTGMFKEIVASRYLLRNSYENSGVNYLRQNANTHIDINSNKISLGATVQINTKNSLTINYANNPFKKSDGDLTLSEYFDRAMNPTASLYADNSENSMQSSQDYLFGYRKIFDKKNEELTLDYSYSAVKISQDQPLNYFFLHDSITKEIMYSSSHNFNSNLQVNWVRPLGENSKLECGIQNTIRQTNSDYSQNSWLLNSWVEEFTQRNSFNYNENISAGYTTYTGKLKSLSYIAGIRLEQTNIKGLEHVSHATIDRDYFNLYPSFNIQYFLNPNSNLQWSYSRKISRPSARMINPFVERSNREVQRYGNPELNPEYVNSMETGYNATIDRTTIGVTLFYKHISALINQVTVLDSVGVSHIAPANVGVGQNFGFELTLDQPISTWWKLSGNGSFYKNMIDSYDGSRSNSDYSYSARLNNMFTPFQKTSIQLVGNYTGPLISLSSKMEAQFSIDIAVKRKFFDKKLVLIARATDIFNTLRNSYTAYGANYSADNWRKLETQVGYLSITYTFGSNGQSKKSKSNVNIESDHSKEIF